MTTDLKRLYTLQDQILYEAEKAKIESAYVGFKDTQKFAEYEKLQEKGNCLNAMLWISIKDMLGLWGQPETLGVREGWKIVLFKNPFEGIFKGLLGL